MFFVLKIKSVCVREDGSTDEEIEFHPATFVRLGETATTEEEFRAIREKYASASKDLQLRHSTFPGRFILSKVVRINNGDVVSRFLVSNAWILGPGGSTIERIAP